MYIFITDFALYFLIHNEYNKMTMNNNETRRKDYDDVLTFSGSRSWHL
jgi:hypothetical protein